MTLILVCLGAVALAAATLWALDKLIKLAAGRSMNSL